MRRTPALAYLGRPARDRLSALPDSGFRPQLTDRMAFWKKLLGSTNRKPVDYYREGKELFDNNKFHEALTSFRLALKEAPGDALVLQEIAMCYTRIGMTEEAVKTYQHVLQKNPRAVGAHYGLAFLLLKDKRHEESIQHLEAFLSNPPDGEEAGFYIEHARSTLAQLRGQEHDAPTEPPA